MSRLELLICEHKLENLAGLVVQPWELERVALTVACALVDTCSVLVSVV